MKKALSLLLVALLIISAMPTFVFAESVTNDFYNAENWQELNASTGNPVSWGATTIGTATKDGETVDVIKVNAYSSFCHAIKLAVEANQEYVVSFDYQSPVFGTFGSKTAAIESLGVAPLKDGELAGRSHSKLLFILTDSYENVTKDIIAVCGRGVSVIPAKGGYTGQDKQLLMCVVRAHEVSRVRKVVASYDEKPFIIIADSSEVLGEGFKSHDDTL